MVSSSVSELEKNKVSLEEDPRWQLVNRACQGISLSRATHLRAILLYIVRQSILHPDEHIREYEIACDVLGRKANFDPLGDNIVRVQMGHLRKKLELYFSAEGKHEDLVITLPRGSYNPVFSDRLSATRHAAQELEVAGGPHESSDSTWTEPVSGAHSSVAAVHPQPASKALWIAGACIAALICGGVIGHIVRPPDKTIKAATVSNPILRRIFAPDTNVNVVLADTSLVMLQNTIHSDITLGEYLDRRYPDNVLANTKEPILHGIMSDLAQHHFTSLDDADIVSHAFQWGSLLGAKPAVRYARYMHVRDFEQGNFIIVGSRRGNLWTSLFEKQLNFYFEEDPASHTFHFRNLHPRPGESEIYALGTNADGQTTGYVDIAILPNITGTGSVLLLNGFSMETNEAAANLIFTNDLPPALSQLISSQPPNAKIEILLRTQNLDGAERGWDIVTTRVGAS